MSGFYLPFPRSNRDIETGDIVEVIKSNLNPSALTHTFRRLTFILKNEEASSCFHTSSSHEQHPCFPFVFLSPGMWCSPGSSEDIKDHRITEMFCCDHPAPTNHTLQSGAVSLLLRMMDKPCQTRILHINTPVVDVTERSRVITNGLMNLLSSLCAPTAPMSGSA